MSLAPQQFCVRWNSYHTNLQTVFPKLLSTENFVDVTLACENRQIKCHKVVLSACSTYFEKLLIQNPCKHPIIFMKDMRFSEMQSLVDFMYKGEVNVSQDDLPSLLKSAEALQIRGLCGSESGDPVKDNAMKSSSSSSPRSSGKENSPQPNNESQKDTSASKSFFGNEHSSQRVTSTNSPINNTPSSPSSVIKKRKDNSSPMSSESPTEIKGNKRNGEITLKEEMVEEDGLFYGEMDNEEIECADNGDDDLSQRVNAGSQQTSDFAISNVTCEYDTSSSPPPLTDITPSIVTNEDHNYNAHNLLIIDQCEPPAFIIKQQPQESLQRSIITPNNAHLNQQLLEMSRKLLAAGNSAQLCSALNTNSGSMVMRSMQQSQTNSTPDFAITKRIRRSEDLLKKAADCVSRGQTFQTVSDQFNIPISTIRFFMARKGILPRRKRGRSSVGQYGPENTAAYQMQQQNQPHQQQQQGQPPSPTQPPYHMAHFKLPDLDLGKVS